jgi:hypothetical protein
LTARTFHSPILQCARTLVLACSVTSATACSAIRGYPESPEDTDAAVARLSAAAEAARAQYEQATDIQIRTALRNRIVYAELQIQEILFTDFQARLWADNNIFTTGGDLIILILSGLGATTGDAGTKAALSAASAGIVGARGVISKDIFYQRTLPAILAQMSANRDLVKAAILDNMNKKDDITYPIAAAEMDLQVLQRASGIANAVQNITQTAVARKELAAAEVNAARQGTFSRAKTAMRIRAWIGFGVDPITGVRLTPNSENLARLQRWVDDHLGGLPVQQLLDDTQLNMEKYRQQAISDLNIP